MHTSTSTETLVGLGSKGFGSLSTSSLWGPLDTIPFLGSLISSGASSSREDPLGTIQVIGDLPTRRSQSTKSTRSKAPQAYDDDSDDEVNPPRRSLADARTSTSSERKTKPGHKRWISMSSIRKRQKKGRPTLIDCFPTIDTVLSGTEPELEVDIDDYEVFPRVSFESVQSNGTSESWKYVTGVRSMTLSFESLSGESVLRAAREEEAVCPYDKETLERMKTRRGLIEELLETEEGYISDLRSLLMMHQSLLGERSLAPKLENIRRIIQTLLEFHDKLLKELFLLFPASCRMAKDLVREKTDLRDVNHVLSGPKAASLIARTFDRLAKEMYIYEEYAAQHSLVLAEIEERKNKIQAWRMLERGCEALCISTMPGYTTANEGGKRGATFDDLAMKPIQRICRYTLLLDQLLSVTPSKDCPDANRLLEGAVHKLREATLLIDNASNRELFPRMEKTWILQRRLALDGESNFSFRGLGRNLLCGVLHATWQEDGDAVGQYMVCLLYRHYLLLATVTSGQSPRYVVQFAITLAFVRVEEVSSCVNLDVVTSLHSFRLCFEQDQNFYEMVLTACCHEEEIKWRDTITKKSHRANNEYYQYDSSFPTVPQPLRRGITPLPLLSGAKRKPPPALSTLNLASSTPALTPILLRIAILNTASQVVPSHAKAPQLPTRSATSSSSGITVLAPRPSDRITLENYLCDVWSTKALAMGLMGRPARTANMRRFSVRSLSSLNSLPTRLSSRRSNGSTNESEESFVEIQSLSSIAADRPKTVSPAAFPPQQSQFNLSSPSPKRTRSAPDFSKAFGRLSTPASLSKTNSGKVKAEKSRRDETSGSETEKAGEGSKGLASYWTKTGNGNGSNTSGGTARFKHKFESIGRTDFAKGLKKIFGSVKRENSKSSRET